MMNKTTILQAERYETLEELSKFPQFYYIKVLPIASNHMAFSNRFLKEVQLEIVYSGNLTNDQIQYESRQKYAQFVRTYEYELAVYAAAYQAYQQQQMQEYQQQAQRGSDPITFTPEGQDPQQNYYPQYNAYQQQGYGGYQGGNQGYQQGYQQGYSQQQQYQQQVYQQQQQQYQNQYQQPQNNQGGYQRQNQYRHPRNQEEQGEYRQQRQHHDQPRHYNNQQGYNNQNHGQGHQQPDRGQGQGQRNYPNQNQQQNQQNQNPKYHEKNIQQQQAVPQPVAQPPPPPPKPQPQPMKFSIDQIKEFINNKANAQAIKKSASPEIINKVDELNKWKSKEEDVQIKQDPKMNKKDSKRPQNNDQGQRFDKGSKYTPSAADDKNAINTGGNFKKNTNIDIIIGKNQTIQSRLIKQDIKGKAGQDFATVMEKQHASLSEVEKAKKEIVYNLNLLAPENLKDIQVDLIPFLFQDPLICKVLIEQIIEKAWDQPKYASTYASLCKSFAEKSPKEFKFYVQKQGAQKKKEKNPFQLNLIESVQHSFDNKSQKLPEFKDQNQKDVYFKQHKKKILGNVKFIAELLNTKVLKRKITKYCISQLLSTFLNQFYHFYKNNQAECSTYDYYFEAVIEFIENIGEGYEKIDDEKEKGDKGEKKSYYSYLQKVVESTANLSKEPTHDDLVNFQNLSGDQFFRLLGLIDLKIIKKHNARLSALLKNLEERRGNKWQKHLSAADGPKKLKQMREDILREEDQANSKVQQASKAKQQIERLDKKVKQLFEAYQADKKEEVREIKSILKSYHEKQFYLSFLRQVADEKKELVAKRISLFEVVLEQNFSLNDFKQAWIAAIKDLAFNSGDFPFCGAALARIIQLLSERRQIHFQDFFYRSEDEDQQWFMEEVYQKLYHYTQKQQILKFVPKKDKLMGLF